jgi:hypothetical protein
MLAGLPQQVAPQFPALNIFARRLAQIGSVRKERCLRRPLMWSSCAIAIVPCESPESCIRSGNGAMIKCHLVCKASQSTKNRSLIYKE